MPSEVVRAWHHGRLGGRFHRGRLLLHMLGRGLLQLTLSRIYGGNYGDDRDEMADVCALSGGCRFTRFRKRKWCMVMILRFHLLAMIHTLRSIYACPAKQALSFFLVAPFLTHLLFFTFLHSKK